MSDLDDIIERSKKKVANYDYEKYRQDIEDEAIERGVEYTVFEDDMFGASKQNNTNYKPFILSGIFLFFVVGGIIYYRKKKKNGKKK